MIVNGHNIEPEADLEGADLQDAKLLNANLEGANLRDARLHGANLQGAYLEGADLRYANLRYANLRGAYLEGANLQGADLQGAYLEGANLQGADLQGADLQGANLQGADLREANLRDVILQGADLTNYKGVQAFYLGKHFGFSYSYKGTIYVQIGCNHYSLEYWLNNVESIGKYHRYTNYEIEYYKAQLNLIAMMEYKKGKSIGNKVKIEGN